MDLDEILDEVGHFGKFQAINYLLVGIPILLSAVFGLTYVFTAGDLDYRCRIPECDEKQTFYRTDWLKNAVPSDYSDSEFKPSRCLRYSLNNTSLSFDGSNVSVCPSEMFNMDKSQRCHEWVYDGKETTIVNEWDITCDENDWKLTLVGTVNNIGQFIGFPLCGFFSDRFGRKTALVATTVLAGVFGLARSMAWNYEAFLFFEFLDPATGSGMYSAGFILGLELVGPSARVQGSTLISVFYTLGEILLGGIAWWLQDWRILLRVFYVPAVLCAIYYWLLPESVRWLLAMKRTNDAKNIIFKAAKRNGVVLSDAILEKLEINSLVEENTGTSNIEAKSIKEVLRQVLHSKILLLRLINCSFCWATNTFVFYGLSLTSVYMGGNKYTNFIVVALIELPAYFVFYLCMDRFGRKIMLSSTLILAGISCISFAFIPLDLEWVRMLFFLLGKFSITIAFTVVYVYTAEMFPTELRHSLLGTCAMVGRIGSMVAPQTPLLQRYFESLPLILFGVMAILSGTLSVYFPETLNVKLPDTIIEAENIGKKTSRTPR